MKVSFPRLSTHPGVSFSVVLCDDVGDFDLNSFPFQIICLDDLGIDALPEMIARYNITELNSAIKPFAFDFLHEKSPGVPVVYFDPDILVASPLVELFAALEAGADCVLTPHMIEPSEWAEMHEGRLLQYGVYNLGFLALRGTSEVQRICRWWGRRLQTECLIDLSRGLFVDQKWADLFPSFIEKTHILRHPGYNVGYWNLSHRRVTFEGGAWLVNVLPLRFFHFSGSVIAAPSSFSRHSSFYVKGGLRALDALFENYCTAVRRNGLAHYQIEYPFSWNGPRNLNEHTPKGAPGGSIADAKEPTSIFSETNFPHLPVLVAASQDEFLLKTGAIEGIDAKRRKIEDALVPVIDPFRVPAYCVVCGKQEEFVVSSTYSHGKFEDGRAIPNWREHLNCSCGLTNRLRATLHILHQEMPPAQSDHIYLTEEATPFYSWL